MVVVVQSIFHIKKFSKKETFMVFAVNSLSVSVIP